MENNNINCFKMRMDLSAIPEDVIPIIVRYLLKFDNSYKFNKIFRKNNDNHLLKYFFGNDENIFRYVNNFITYDYKIECKEINIEPIMDYISKSFNTKITKIKLFYSLDDFYDGEVLGIHLYDNLKIYDENNIRINIQKLMSDYSENRQTRNRFYTIARLIDKLNIEKQLTEYDHKLNQHFLNILGSFFSLIICIFI